MESFLNWLNGLSQDADPAQSGFQAQWLYIVICVSGPVVFGAFIAGVMTGLERVFGIKLSSKGGH
jgi:hypothetical protein